MTKEDASGLKKIYIIFPALFLGSLACDTLLRIVSGTPSAVGKAIGLLLMFAIYMLTRIGEDRGPRRVLTIVFLAYALAALGLALAQWVLDPLYWSGIIVFGLGLFYALVRPTAHERQVRS
jgi:hypothetical protein